MRVSPFGTITSVPGFLAGATCCGIKKTHELDLALLYSEEPCVAAALFTRNRIQSAPVQLSRQRLRRARARAIVANSACANACVGKQGIWDATEMTRIAAENLAVPSEEVLVAGTGVIGARLPLERIHEGLKSMVPDEHGGHAFAQAIMTTDTVPKEAATTVDLGTARVTIGGVAKGSGMIHPDLATMLVFLCTDLRADARFLRSALKRAVANSFNLLSIDGDTSPSDSVFLLANGIARNPRLDGYKRLVFEEALTGLCQQLADSIARDGEGATKAIKVMVEGASNQRQARQATRTIVSSPLVKAALHGNDPNWGRIVTALGRSGVEVREDRLDVYLCNTCVMKEGQPVYFDPTDVRASLAVPEVLVRVYLNLGEGSAMARGCDLSEEYVTINSSYTT